MRTTVAVVNAPGEDFVLEEVDVDGPRAGEVLVRVVASGLCHTDLTLRGQLPAEMFPRVFGHEGAGVVEAVGPGVTHVQPGDQVVLSFSSCRECGRCRTGQAGYCEQSMMLNYLGFRADGSTSYSRASGPVYGHFFGQSAFARHAIAYAGSVVPVGPDVDLVRAAPYGCGFQTGAGAVLNVAQAGPGDSVVVYGVGAVGLAAVAAARASGVENVVAVDLQASRLAAAARLGAVGLDPAAVEGTVVDRVRELTGGGATAAIDTTAVPSVLYGAAQALGVRGTLVVLGLDMTKAEFPIDAVDLLQSGKVVRGSIEGDSDPFEMVPRLLAMNAEGRLPLDDLVATYSFDDIATAVADAESGAVVKPVLVWE